MLRVLSYNIRHGEGMDGQIDLGRIAEVIGRQGPDLVALQEVDKGCKRTDGRDIAAELGALLNIEHRFARFMPYQGGDYGVAVLSRLPVVGTSVHRIPGRVDEYCVLEVRVQVDGVATPVSFVSLHNDYRDESTRVSQVEAIHEALGNVERPVILAGDFNAERTGPSLQYLADHGWEFLDKTGNSKTYPADDPKVEIDFFAIRGVSTVSFEHEVVDERVASDHKPISAAITYKEMEENIR